MSTIDMQDHGKENAYESPVRVECVKASMPLMMSDAELQLLANAPRQRLMRKREEARQRSVASREAASGAARQRLGAAKAAAEKAAMHARLARKAWIEALMEEESSDTPTGSELTCQRPQRTYE